MLDFLLIYNLLVKLNTLYMRPPCRAYTPIYIYINIHIYPYIISINFWVSILGWIFSVCISYKCWEGRGGQLDGSVCAVWDCRTSRTTIDICQNEFWTTSSTANGCEPTKTSAGTVFHGILLITMKSDTFMLWFDIMGFLNALYCTAYRRY